MEDFSEKLMNMNEDEYYKGWLSLEEDNALMDKIEGIEIGKEEANLSIAKNLLEMGMSVEDISKVTNLSIEEIERLK